MGKLGLILMGGAMLSKSSIQFSVDGRGCVPSLLFGLLHALIFITSAIVWPQVNSREESKLHLSTENWIKDLLSMALSIRTRPSFPLSQSLPSGRFPKPLILIHQRADRLKTTSQKTSQSALTDHSRV